MYFRYQSIYWHEFENNEVERISSFTCTTLCYILKYIYIGQIAKRRTSTVLAINIRPNTLPDQVTGRMCGCVLHVESKHMNCASF